MQGYSEAAKALYSQALIYENVVANIVFCRLDLCMFSRRLILPLLSRHFGFYNMALPNRDLDPRWIGSFASKGSKGYSESSSICFEAQGTSNFGVFRRLRSRKRFISDYFDCTGSHISRPPS